jgi:ABC-2 type transport system permease protein
MKAFTQLFLANLREFARDRMALFWTIAFPVLFMLIFGLIFGRDNGFSADLGLVIEDHGAAAGQLAQAFKQADVFKISEGARADELAALREGKRDAVIIIPAGASDAVSHGQAAPVELHYDPARSSSQIVQSIVDQVLQDAAQQIRPQPEVFQLNRIPVQAQSLSAIDFLIPGILAMSILNLALFATAQPIISLRTQGVLRRLGATPLPRPTLLAAYICMRVAIALFQTGIIVAVGIALFGMSMTGNWLLFGGVLLLGTLAFIAIAFLIAAIARTEESGSALTSAVQLPMLFLSGLFFPVETLPGFLRPVVDALPLTYLADALRQVMVGATPYHSMAVNTLVLLAWLVVAGVLASRFFRWE